MDTTNYNLKKISREKLDLLLNKQQYSEALDLALEHNMNSGFMKSLELWLSSINDISLNVIYSNELF